MAILSKILGHGHSMDRRIFVMCVCASFLLAPMHTHSEHDTT